MAQGVHVWSKTAASNGTADATIGMSEGQTPGSLNDGIRALMARIGEYRDDTAGSLVTGGTTSAYTLTSNSVFASLALMSGQLIAFVPNATNANTVGNDVTLAVDGLAAKPIRMQSGVALPDGTLIAGTPYICTYNSVDAVFYLQNMTNPYHVPLGSGMDFWLPTAPNSAFVFPIGQAISRTTYATLFALMSTTFGAGNGTTTFNLPDKRGRASVAADSSAGRITGAVFNALTPGGVGGTETHTLTVAQLPTGITSVGTASSISVTSTENFIPSNQTASSRPSTGGGTNVADWGAGASTLGQIHSTGSGSASVTSNNTSGNAHLNVQPSIVCNYILRVL